MNRWTKVEAFLDKEVQRETKRIIAKAKAAMGLGNGNGHTKPIEAKRRKSSAKVKSARQLHGKYLGLTRGLTPQDRSEVAKQRIDKGVRAAIAMAKRLRKAAAEA